MSNTKKGIGVSLMVLFMMISAQGICWADNMIGTWHHETIKGVVVAIDRNTREITVKDWTGGKMTFAVDGKVGQLDNIAMGDSVTGQYCIAYNADFRSPTYKERKLPFVILGETEVELEDATPGTRVRVFRDVMNIKGVENNVGMIFLTSSQGEPITVYDGTLKEKAKVYNTVIATYTEPLILSIKNR